MWSDNETAVDLLGYRHLVAGVTGVIRKAELLPATIGVFGDWGSGKSSLLKMIEGELAGDDGVLLLSFNGWLFEGYEDAKSALMGVILDEIERQKTLSARAQELLGKLLRRVDWFRVAGSALKHGAAFAVAGPAGLGLTAAADLSGLLTQISGKAKESAQQLDPGAIAEFLARQPGREARQAIREFRDDFGKLLDETKIKTLVVVIDDLDRCLPDAVIETLEAIKLFLFVPRTAFVIGADERLVRYAVRRRFPELPGEAAEVGREYLEKLIQYPVRIPPLDGGEVETYVNLLFAQISGVAGDDFDRVREHVLADSADTFMHTRFDLRIAHQILAKVSSTLATNLGIGQRIAPVLGAGLKGNPRQCKRFLNTLVMRTAMARSRGLSLQQRILAKLMLLEYLKSEYFRKVAVLQASEEGRPGALRLLERAATGGKDPVVQPDAEADGAGNRPKKRVRGKPDPEGAEAEPEEQLPADLRAWLSDAWMKDWLRMEPALAGEDLRPYFFFSRDRLGPLGAMAARMTPAAQETLQRLLHESEAQQKLALRNAGDLSPSDATAVFEALCGRVEEEEDLADERSLLPRTLSWAGARPELATQCVAFMGRLPADRLPVVITLKVADLVKGTDAAAAGRVLLDRWRTGASETNKRLAQAAERALERLG